MRPLFPRDPTSLQQSRSLSLYLSLSPPPPAPPSSPSLPLSLTLSKDGSAFRDGRVKVGDQVVAVDGLSIENMTQEQIDGENGCLIGPYGTIVILTIMSSDGKKSEVKTSAARKAKHVSS